MLHGLPVFIILLFICTTALTASFLVKGIKATFIFSILLLLWLILQSLLASKGFYLVKETFPPRLAFATMPPFLAVLALFIFPNGRRLIEKADASILTLLHLIRILVEICLFYLSVYKLVPQMMTFSGQNFDIFSGLSAPFIWWFGYKKVILGKGLLIFWNVICLLLLLNVVVHGILAAPTTFQKLAFDQPNVAILYYPFIWLPAFVVPSVLLSHLICLRRLFVRKREIPDPDQINGV